MENPFQNSPRELYCKLYIVRHGETDWNVMRKIQGNTDIPLNEVGIKQAEEIGKRFVDERLAIAFSSDLLRAKKTAKIISAQHNLNVIAKEVLREKNFGEMEGKHQSDMIKAYSLYEKLASKEISNHRIANGAETDEEVIARILTFLRETSLAYKGKNVLVVSHGGILRLLLIHLGLGSYKNFPPGSIKNTAIITLLSDGVDFYAEAVEGVIRSG